MERGLGAFFRAEHFLVELLAGTQARVLHLYVLGSREFNHALGKVGNAHRLAHVEDEDFAAVALGACFKHELAGFGNEHEVAYNVGMRYGDWAALLYLLLEQGND